MSILFFVLPWRGCSIRSFLLAVDSFVFLFSCLLNSHFVASVLVACLRCVHRWSARSSPRVTVSASAVPFVLNIGSCCWHTVCTGNPFSGRVPSVHGVIGVLPRPYRGLPTAQCIESSRRSAVISLCRPMWRPLAAAAEGANSFTSRSFWTTDRKKWRVYKTLTRVEADTTS